MLDSILTSNSIGQILICLLCSLVFGVITVLVFSFKNRMTPSLAVALVILPVAMNMIVMMINGNLGIAVAVAGSFTLVRFRSIAGTGREISAVFVVMTIGVIMGVGYVGIAAIFLAIVAVIVIGLKLLGFSERPHEKLLRITIPENYDYTTLFDDIFQKYGVKAKIDKIKTTNLGSLIDVTYLVNLPKGGMSKEMLDDIRTKNGNLCVMLTNYEAERDTL